MFGRKKKNGGSKGAKGGSEDPAPDIYFGVDLRATVEPAIEAAKRERARHNPYQSLVPAAAGEQRTSRELVDAAIAQPIPEEVRVALVTIAGRFEQMVGNVNALNRAMHEFKDQVVQPFREELKHLRYSTGDRLNKTSTNLEIYVDKLEKVMWGALRAQGMSDAQIRTFREENGMQPEAPTSDELTHHLDEIQAMKRTIEDLTRQNRRLIALNTGHVFKTDFGRPVVEWEYQEVCVCAVCHDHREALEQAGTEANRA